MKLDDVKRHAEHMCDVYLTGDVFDHMGVIAEYHVNTIGGVNVLVDGHPEYDALWFTSDEIATSCTITD